MNCFFCGETVDLNTSDVHHIVKRSKGGKDDKENLRRICTRCHRLVHVAEKMLRKGRPDSVILDYLVAFLTSVNLANQQKVSRSILAAAHSALCESESLDRVFVPFEVRIPTKMHEDLAKKAEQLNVSRNDLILWAISELLSGRVLLPNRVRGYSHTT